MADADEEWPDFTDPAVQAWPIHAAMLQILLEVGERWRPIDLEIATRGEAALYLERAGAIVTNGQPRRITHPLPEWWEAKLTDDGIRWQATLHSLPDEQIKARGLVLALIARRYEARRHLWAPSPPADSHSVAPEEPPEVVSLSDQAEDDAVIGRALELISKRPNEGWGFASLAREIAGDDQSRTEAIRVRLQRSSHVRTLVERAKAERRAALNEKAAGFEF